MVTWDAASHGSLVEKLAGYRLTVDELEQLLPRRYRRLVLQGSLDRAVWVDVCRPSLLEVACSGGVVCAHAAVELDDFAAVLENDLHAMRSPREAMDALESAYGGLHVIESFRRGVRLSMASFPLIVELRGRKSLERVQVLSGEPVYRILDTQCRSEQASRPPERLGPWRGIGENRFLSADGWYGAERLDSGGYSVCSPPVYIEWVAGWLAQDTYVPLVDARLAGVWSNFMRRDRVLDTGNVGTEWWLPNVGVRVSMESGQAPSVSIVR